MNTFTSEQLTIIKQAQDIIKSSLQSSYDLECSGSEVVRAYCHNLIGADKIESFNVLYLDTQNRLIKSEQLFTGTINACSVYPREVVKGCLTNNANSIILFHNHPSGEPTPSQADQLITNKLASALSHIDVGILDHIIVTADVNKYTSFAQECLNLQG